MKTLNNIDKKSKKRILITLSVSALLLFSLSAFLIKPLYIGINANVLYRNTMLIPVLEMLILVLENFAYGICFAAVIYSVFRFSLQTSVDTISLCAGTLLFKNLSAFAADSVSAGYIDINDLLLNLLWFSFDLIKLLLVIIISTALIKQFYKKDALTSPTSEKDKKLSVCDEILGKKFFFSKHNPLCTSALASALIILSTELYSETRYYIANGFFASFKYSLWMISDYILDILITCIIYLLSLYLFTHFHSKETGSTGKTS